MPHTRDSPSPQDARDQRYRNWDAYDEDDEPDPFKDLIQKDPVVCDHCFVVRYETVNHEWWRGTFGWSDYSRWVPLPEKSKAVPADEPSEGMRLACANCGNRKTKQRPVAKDEIEDFAENISSTLDFKEIEHDRSVLLSVIEDRNTSENQGRQDSHVFAPAVQRAIQAVQG